MLPSHEWPARRPEVRCTQRLTVDAWFTRAVFALAAGVFLFNLLRYLGGRL